MNGTQHFSKGNDQESCSEDEECSYSSYSSCSYSDSDSTIPDWDSSVDERTGEVLYIECHPYVTQNIKEKSNETGAGAAEAKSFSRSQNRQSTRGKFLKLLRRRESKRNRSAIAKVQEKEQSKVKFQDCQEGEEREVFLKLASTNHVKPENCLGINTSTLSDGIRLMVAGFVQNSSAKYEKNIKIGDWLKSINGIEVNCQNINSVLAQLLKSKTNTEVLVKVQRVAGVDVTKDPPINILNNQSAFVRQLTTYNAEENVEFQENLSKLPLAFLCLTTEESTSNENAEFSDVLYSFPRPVQKNILASLKGIFLTLNHLLDTVTKTAVKSTYFMYKTIECNVIYKSNAENILILFMLPKRLVKLFEAEAVVGQICAMFEFCHNTLSDCFKSENHQQLDHVFTMIFSKILNGYCADSKIPAEIPSEISENYEFEDALPAVKTLELPNEAMIQIEDALSELEACDYREWNEEPLDCQRIFTMLGSAWYHSAYLISSHLTHEDLKDVHFFLKFHGILHLSTTEPVKTLIVWREVYPTSTRKWNLPSEFYKFPNARRYLLVVGSGKDLLAVIMESGGCTEPAEENAPPDPFYVEEAQATLSHLQELGISELADRFIGMNPGPQVTVPTPPNSKNSKNNIFSKSPQSNSQISNLKKVEVTSILKRRNNDVSTSSNSLVEDSATTFDLRSECGESVNYDSNGSEYSENDEINTTTTDGSQMSTNSFDISELKQMLLSETEDIQPARITSGPENVLYHFLQFDKLEGILLCPPDCKLENSTRKSVIENFRRCSQKIHKIFQNTIRFKDMSSAEMAKSVMNKSLIAIKEHGTLFECNLDEKDVKKNKILYWVIGRLFFHPHVRELYVCYNDSIPQNMIEMAFKINMGFCD